MNMKNYLAIIAVSLLTLTTGSSLAARANTWMNENLSTGATHESAVSVNDTHANRPSQSEANASLNLNSLFAGWFNTNSSSQASETAKTDMQLNANASLKSYLSQSDTDPCGILCRLHLYSFFQLFLGSK